MNDDKTGDPAPGRVPKYKAPDFMLKEMGLFYRAKYETALMRRYGDNDAPVSAIQPLQGIRSVRPVRGIRGIVNDDPNTF